MQDNVAAILTPLSKDAATQTEFTLSPDSSPFFPEVYRTLWTARHSRMIKQHIADAEKMQGLNQTALKELEDGEDEKRLRKILVDEIAQGALNTSSEMEDLLDNLDWRFGQKEQKTVTLEDEIREIIRMTCTQQLALPGVDIELYTNVTVPFIGIGQRLLDQVTVLAGIVVRRRSRLRRLKLDALSEDLRTTASYRQRRLLWWDETTLLSSQLSETGQRNTLNLNKFAKKIEFELAKVEEIQSDSVLDLVLEWKRNKMEN